MSQFGTIAMGVLLAVAPAMALKNRPGRIMSPVYFAAPECSDHLEANLEPRTEVPGGFENLPKGLLVARDADYSIEGRSQQGQPIRIQAYQSFLKDKQRQYGKVLCGSVPEEYADRLSMFAPTLIDLGSGRKTGHSFWQFQVLTDGKAFSVWNKKSPSLASTDKIEKQLKDLKTNYRLYQIGHNEYELVVTKEVAGLNHQVSIRYDAVK